jgi:hypothetical protein
MFVQHDRFVRRGHVGMSGRSLAVAGRGDSVACACTDRFDMTTPATMITTSMHTATAIFMRASESIGKIPNLWG